MAQQTATQVQSDKDAYRLKICRHINDVRLLIGNGITELWKRYTQHDMSKLREPEASDFEKGFPALQAAEYGTDAYNKAKDAVDVAIKHHFSVNRHHPEHFANGIDGMNLIDLFEMLCDWYAAAANYGTNGNITRSIKHNKGRFGLSDQMVSILENTVTWLKECEASAQRRPDPDDRKGADNGQQSSVTP